VNNFAPTSALGAYSGGEVCISIDEGTVVSIVGPSGSGKTRFCLLICGLGSDLPTKGCAIFRGNDISFLPEEQRALATAYVPSDASLLFSGIKGSLSGELNLAWQLLGSPLMADRIERVTELFRLNHLLDRDPFTLSGGEATRAAVALAVLKMPDVLAIDQAYDNLDPASVKEIRYAIESYLPSTSVIVETFARTPFWLEQSLVAGQAHIQGTTPDFRPWKIFVRARSPVNTDNCLETEQRDPCPIQPLPATPAPTSTRRELLNVAGMSFKYDSSAFQLGPLDLTVRANERVAVVGPNGVGKTTLLKCLALLCRPAYERFDLQLSADTTVVPPELDDVHSWARFALYSFQNPDDQLYLATVRKEIIETAERLNSAGPGRALEIAHQLGLDAVLDQSPFELPRPYRRLVSIAATLAAETPLLLLDEPTVGLDDAQTFRLIDALQSFRPPGSALIMISHDQQFVAAVATRVIKLTPECSRRRLAA